LDATFRDRLLPGVEFGQSQDGFGDGVTIDPPGTKRHAATSRRS